jgi:hypothetical protein
MRMRRLAGAAHIRQSTGHRTRRPLSIWAYKTSIKPYFIGVFTRCSMSRNVEHLADVEHLARCSVPANVEQLGKTPDFIGFFAQKSSQMLKFPAY